MCLCYPTVKEDDREQGAVEHKIKKENTVKFSCSDLNIRLSRVNLQKNKNLD